MGLRLFIAIFFFIVIAGIVTYFLIPSPLKISGRTVLHTSADGAYRVLTTQKVWDSLSPENFSITKKLAKSVEIDVKNNNIHVPVFLLLIPLSRDSVAISWSGNFPVTKNPITKIRQYGRATAVRDKMDHALQNFQSYVEQNENVYGFHIKETSTKDTFLIATRFGSTKYPSLELIYSYIEKLQTFAKTSGVTQTGAPMLNVSTTDSVHYNNMVALPISKIVPDGDSISFIRMVPGRFLTTEIKGGPYTIDNARKTMDQYFRDFNRISMAIPFQYLETNRLTEQDTTKWITRIYNPVY